MAEKIVILALNRKYAELKGHLVRHNAEATKLRKSMAHVEATIRLFRDDYDVSAIAPIVPNKAVRWRSKGYGIRLAIDALREAGKPMTTQELAVLTMERAGIPYDLQTARDVAASLRQSLKRRVGIGVVMVEGYPTRWALDYI
ncbi:hypothetical protein [Sphingorhabdus sp.]|uniref:hypothetical protein n=1 Tax=Sphingorhabdus sp. TaxID=1902408 RepID=UPI003983117D